VVLLSGAGGGGTGLYDDEGWDTLPAASASTSHEMSAKAAVGWRASEMSHGVDDAAEGVRSEAAELLLRSIDACVSPLTWERERKVGKGEHS
jgi:hypothetical protein